MTIQKYLFKFSMNSLIASQALLYGSASFAFPVDPAKVPVSEINQSGLSGQYTLAYDSDNKSVIYYAPKSGRVALFNGMPLLGFGVLNDGRGVLQTQFQFEIEPHDRDKLFQRIQARGYSPVPLPFNKTTIKPLLQGWDPETGKLICAEIVDSVTGEVSKDCSQSMYEAVTFIKNGPSLGENLAISTMLTPMGAALMKSLLNGGNAFQVSLEGEYYAATDAFTAVVEVNYEKLYEDFSAHAGVKGFLYQAEAEAFWKKEGLCVGRPADQCSVVIHLTDGRGRKIDNITVDPDNADGKLVWEAVQQLKNKLQDEMLIPISAVLSKADSSMPLLGWKANAKFQHLKVEKHAKFEFKTTRGVIAKKTVITAGVACVSVDANGSVKRNADGDCSRYWEGTLGFDELVRAKKR